MSSSVVAIARTGIAAGTSATVEATALLPLGEADSWARADTDGCSAALGKGRAARGCAVSIAEALAGDELSARTVAEVLLAGGVRLELPGGEVGGGLDSCEGESERGEDGSEVDHLAGVLELDLG